MKIEDIIGETTEYEKKQSLEIKKPKSWCKTVSAFANSSENGGTLIFGVNDDNKIIGLKNAERDAEIISEQIKYRINPIPEFDLRFHKTDSQKVLIILNIFAGEQTPYYYDADGSLVAYYRIGNQSVPVSSIKLKELILKGSSTSFDSLESKYNFDEMSFIKLKSSYKSRTGNSFTTSDFESFGIVSESGKLTNAGALLADDSQIIQSRIFCTRWNGIDKAPGIIDALDDKEYTGDLISLLQNGVEFIKNNSKKSWMKTSNGRVELPDYPERSVLEGIVNALIHRNYLEIGSEIHIDLFDDRLEIYSPGGMYDGTRVQNRDIMSVPSKRRNPVVADIFNRLKYMDRRGSGFKKILKEYMDHPRYNTKLKPEFRSDYDSFYLILKNLNYVNKKKVTLEVIPKTNVSAEKILRLMLHNPKISRNEIAEEVGISIAGVKYHVRNLRAQGFIEYVGSSKDGYWVVLKEKLTKE